MAKIVKAESPAIKAGLTLTAELDTGIYELGQKLTKEQMASINIKKHRFHPEWNYSNYPNI